MSALDKLVDVKAAKAFVNHPLVVVVVLSLLAFGLVYWLTGGGHVDASKLKKTEDAPARVTRSTAGPKSPAKSTTAAAAPKSPAAPASEKKRERSTSASKNGARRRASPGGGSRELRMLLHKD